MYAGIEQWFSKAASFASHQTGRAHTFILAIAVVIVWACFGPATQFSDTWQLIINTGTTIATFLMVFLLQHSQNRDTLSIMLKLDELIASNKKASNAMLDLEMLTEEQLEQLRLRFKQMAEAQHARSNLPDHLR